MIFFSRETIFIAVFWSLYLLELIVKLALKNAKFMLNLIIWTSDDFSPRKG